MIRLFLIFFILLISSCASAPKPTAIHTCIIRIADKMCWTDKASKQGIALDQLDGYFAQPSQDMNEIMNLLNECGPD